MRKLIVITALTLCVLVAGARKKEKEQSAEPQSPYLTLVELADTAIAHREFQEAINLFHQAMTLEPGNPANIMLISNTGMLYYYLGNDSMAVATLDMAHEMAPNSVTVLLNRANVNNGIGRYSQALVDYTKVTEMDSTLIEPWIQKCMLQLRGGDVRGAEASLAEAEKLGPYAKETYLAKAILFSKTNRPKEALPYLNRLIKKDPSSEYYAERAMCRLQLDDLGGASDDIGKGIELDQLNPDLYVARALLNKRRFREEDSKADARKAINLGANPKFVSALGLSF